MASTSIYLNFPNQTEIAFQFYESVFKTKLSNLNRFSEIPPSPDSPPIPDSIKNLVMHVELQLPGGLVLMGTDAPKEMGFDVVFGNNVYITLSPDSREETERLFNALSEGGKIQQALADMFWGAYYGSCTDKFGVQWMLNFSTVS